MHGFPATYALLPRRRGMASLLWTAPTLALAQASPFMTGATSLQTNILAWLTPVAIILVMVLGAMAMANRLPSPLAERLRAEYRQRVLRRMEQRSAERDADTPTPAQPPAARSTGVAPAQTMDVAEIRRQAREAWLLLRSREVGKADAHFRDQPIGEQQSRARETLPPEPGSQDDLAL